MMVSVYGMKIRMGFPLFLYNLLLLPGLVLLTPFWIFYLALAPKARAGFWQKLGFYPTTLTQQLSQPSGKKRVWFHAVSVGEFNAIKSLIPLLSDEFDVVVSTTTATGYGLATRTFPDLPVFYFPFDLRPVIHTAFKHIRPDLVILTETELWPNVIDIVSRCYRIPLLLINGRLSARSCQGYQWIRFLMKPCLHRFTHLYMQSQPDADRIRALGGLAPTQLTVMGNLKFDINPDVDATKRTILTHLLDITEEDTVLTFASTHSGEDQFLIETYQLLKRDFPELKLILAPRHPERLNEIKGILNAKALSYSVRSQLSEGNPNRQPIVVLDSIGELLIVYSFTQVAVMGGSFVEKGGQNPLEALSLRVPVIFGPHMHNFAEISRMITEQQAGHQVYTQQELINAVTGLLTQPEDYDTIAEKGQQLVENNRGAKDMVLKAIRSHLA